MVAANTKNPAAPAPNPNMARDIAPIPLPTWSMAGPASLLAVTSSASPLLMNPIPAAAIPIPVPSASIGNAAVVAALPNTAIPNATNGIIPTAMPSVLIVLLIFAPFYHPTYSLNRQVC